MNLNDKLFLEALKASLENKTVDWDFEINREAWLMLFQRAEMHQVLPMIYNVIYKCPSAQTLEKEFLNSFKRKVIRQVMVQTMRTQEFLVLYQHLLDQNIHPVMVKGIICRQLYPNPDYRSSSDEDMLVKSREFKECHEAMKSFGMVPGDEKADLDASYEASYTLPGSPLYIELHKSLFSPGSEEYGEFNQFFKSAHARAVKMRIQDVDVYTLNYTDHLFYLICHAFKHLLHGGFGIRQICDMVMFANEYGSQIDWSRIVENCREIRADKFAVALFQIGEKYLVFDPEKACYPKEWRDDFVDEHALLEDLLAGGIYGGATNSRRHSSSLTLNAVKAEKQGKKVKPNIVKAVFPSRNALRGKYPYLEKYPFLLPVAWTSRIVKYQKETMMDKSSKPIDSIKIGNQRIELLKQYGIIKDSLDK